MKIKNFNSGWGQMTITNARGRLLTRLGVENVPERVLAHNNSQEKRERAYNTRFFYGVSSDQLLTGKGLFSMEFILGFAIVFWPMALLSAVFIAGEIWQH